MYKLYTRLLFAMTTRKYKQYITNSNASIPKTTDMASENLCCVDATTTQVKRQAYYSANTSEQRVPRQTLWYWKKKDKEMTDSDIDDNGNKSRYATNSDYNDDSTCDSNNEDIMCSQSDDESSNDAEYGNDILPLTGATDQIGSDIEQDEVSGVVYDGETMHGDWNSQDEHCEITDSSQLEHSQEVDDFDCSLGNGDLMSADCLCDEQETDRDLMSEESSEEVEDDDETPHSNNEDQGSTSSSGKETRVGISVELC